jgi:hypothetical protein
MINLKSLATAAIQTLMVVILFYGFKYLMGDTSEGIEVLLIIYIGVKHYRLNQLRRFER